MPGVASLADGTPKTSFRNPECGRNGPSTFCLTIPSLEPPKLYRRQGSPMKSQAYSLDSEAFSGQILNPLRVHPLVSGLRGPSSNTLASQQENAPAVPCCSRNSEKPRELRDSLLRRCPLQGVAEPARHTKPEESKFHCLRRRRT